MSPINRGPLGSAFRINLDPNQSPTNRPGTNSGSAPAEPRSASTPTLSANGPIPMPGPTSMPIPGPGFNIGAPGAGPVGGGPPGTASAPATTGHGAATATATMEPPVMAPPGAVPAPPPRGSLVATDLARSLAEVKGQAQFLLYLADQIEDSLHQLVEEHDACQNAFLCRILSMYSAQLETKHHGLGDKIAETCQEVYVTVRDYDAT